MGYIIWSPKGLGALLGGAILSVANLFERIDWNQQGGALHLAEVPFFGERNKHTNPQSQTIVKCLLPPLIHMDNFKSHWGGVHAHSVQQLIV